TAARVRRITRMLGESSASGSLTGSVRISVTRPTQAGWTSELHAPERQRAIVVLDSSLGQPNHPEAGGIAPQRAADGARPRLDQLPVPGFVVPVPVATERRLDAVPAE